MTNRSHRKFSGIFFFSSGSILITCPTIFVLVSPCVNANILLVIKTAEISQDQHGL